MLAWEPIPTASRSLSRTEAEATLACDASDRTHVECQRPGVGAGTDAVGQHESIGHLGAHFLAMAALGDRTPVMANLSAGIRHVDTYRFEDRQPAEDRNEVAGTAVRRHPKPRSGGSIAIPPSDLGWRFHPIRRRGVD